MERKTIGYLLLELWRVVRRVGRIGQTCHIDWTLFTVLHQLDTPTSTMLACSQNPRGGSV